MSPIQAPRDSLAIFEYGVRVWEWARPGTIVAVDPRHVPALAAIGGTIAPWTGGARYVVLAHPIDAARPDFRSACLDAIVALMGHQSSPSYRGYVDAKHSDWQPRSPVPPVDAPGTDPAVNFSEHTQTASGRSREEARAEFMGPRRSMRPEGD